MENKLKDLIINSELSIQEICDNCDISVGKYYQFKKKLGLERKYKNNKKFYLNDDFFNKWSSDMAYILGFIVADGCINQPKSGIYKSNQTPHLHIGICQKDVEILHNFKILMHSNHRIIQAKRKNDKYDAKAIINIYSKNIIEQLSKLGIESRKSLTVGWIKNIPTEYTHHFVRGYFDGDGSIFLINVVDNPYKTIHTTLGVSIVGTQNFLQGIVDNYNDHNINVYKHKSIFNISMSCNKAEQFCQWMYDGSTPITRLGRKYSIYRNYIDRKEYISNLNISS